MVLHDRPNGDNDSFWSSDAGTGEIWRMEVVEPGCHFFRRGVCEEEADLTFDVLPTGISV